MGGGGGAGGSVWAAPNPAVASSAAAATKRIVERELFIRCLICPNFSRGTAPAVPDGLAPSRAYRFSIFSRSSRVGWKPRDS